MRVSSDLIRTALCHFAHQKTVPLVSLEQLFVATCLITLSHKLKQQLFSLQPSLTVSTVKVTTNSWLITLLP